ncbi:MAG: DUF4091 domain-containing protein [Deltaproteobacteria bacterium]|nr:DUF4091 domain-containing protein [Deltaproteobacteria bacterium]
MREAVVSASRRGASSACQQSVVIALLALVIGSPRPVRAELSALWAVGESTKVKATQTEHPLRAKNAIFDGKVIKLFGLRNEVVSFQLVLVGGSEATEGVTVQLAALGTIKNGAVSDDPDRYYLERNIEIFVEHYLPIKHPSLKIVWKPWSDSQPKRAHWEGLMPDGLVPHRKPFNVPARRTQGIWVDIYIPKDAPAGVQRGAARIKAGSGHCGLGSCELPVELEVLDKSLPDESHTKTMLYFSGGENDRDAMPARYFKDVWEVDEKKVQALRDRHYKLGRRHRVTMFIGVLDKPDEALKARLSGKAFTRAEGYYGPGEGLGQDIYSIYTYGLKDLDTAAATKWQSFFAQHAPKVDYFYYTLDEPHSAEQYEKVQRRAKRAAAVPSFVTATYRPQLEGVEIFAAIADAYKREAARKAKDAGKRVWIYNGVRPFTGTFMTDDVGCSPRVIPWIQYKYGIPRWFYWESTYYKDFQGDRGHVDVWADPQNFRNGDGDKLNGDGLLIYPGRDLKFPSQDKGIDGPLPSMRLKAWRRGIQDVEYLALAKAAGHQAFVDELLAAMVPRALDETRAGDPVSWPEDGERWVKARRMLFELLKTGKAPTLAREGLARPAEHWWKKSKRTLKRVINPFVRSKKRLAVTGVVGLFGLLLLLLVFRAFFRRRRSR